MRELISRCICGKEEFISFSMSSRRTTQIQILIRECLSCAIKHQFVLSSYQEHMNQYKKDYSCFEGKDGGQLVSGERYTHDYQIARKRLEEYNKVLEKGSDILDIGSGNGAFADCFRNYGYGVKNLEFCENYKGTKIDYQGDFTFLSFLPKSFDVITMHDVLEHLVDPLGALNKCSWILKNKGILIIDFPDFYNLEGLHHWKKTEHLWFLRGDELQEMLLDCGFSIIQIKKPISSKLVFYATKNQS